MQDYRKKTLCAVITLLAFIGCQRNQPFEQVLRKYKQSAVSFAPLVGIGLPYFTKKTLTPTWSLSDDIVNIPSFQLVNQHSQNVTHKIFENRVTLVAFFFTSCAGFCPVLIQKMKKIQKAVASENDFQLVAITVDPAVDTPKKLSSYAKSHRLVPTQDWHLLTGEKQTLYSIASETFESNIKPLGVENNLRKFAHTEHFYLIDKQGRLRAILNGTRTDLSEQAARLVSELQ